MGWRDLIEEEPKRTVSPWTGGRTIYALGRACNVIGRLPVEYGWYAFWILSRVARLIEPAENPLDLDAVDTVVGYLVGDHVVRDDAIVDPDPAKIVLNSEQVHLVEDGLERFARVRAVRLYDEGPLIFAGVEMPLGPEEAVLSAYLDQEASVARVRGVPPALDAAFRMESWQRAEAERRRVENEHLAREEEERRAQEERRAEIEKTLGSSAGRRQLAQVDFEAAARAALAVGGASYLDHRRGARRGEMVVRYRLIDRRFECTCDERTLRIVEAGICLTAHDDDEFEEGVRGDAMFTLESLPGVVQQAHREGKLVVFRHVD